MAEHIKIGDITPRVLEKGDGSQTIFYFKFPIFKDADLNVYLDGVLQKIETQYLVSGAGQTTGGKIIFVTPPSNGAVVVLVRRLAIERKTDFQESGALRSKAINDELDYLTAALQQVSDDQTRSVRLITSDSTVKLELPDKDARAGRIMSFDSAGGVALSSSDSLSLATLQAFMDWKTNIFTGNGVQTVFELSAEPGQVANTQVFWDGVYQSKYNYGVLRKSLTFTTAPPDGVKVEVVHGAASSTFVPDDGSIGAVKLSAAVNSAIITNTEKLTCDATNVAAAGAAMRTGAAFTGAISTTGTFSINSASNAYHFVNRASAITEALTVFQTAGVIKAAIGLNNDATDSLEFFTNGDLATPKVTLDASGNLIVANDFKVTPTASAVNYGQELGGVTGFGRQLRAAGSDVNIGIDHSTKGGGDHYFYSGTRSVINAIVAAATSGVNYPYLVGSTTGTDVVQGVSGSDANIDLRHDTRGSGNHLFFQNGGIQFQVNGATANVVNCLHAFGGVTGDTAKLYAQGTDANVGISFQTKGNGVYFFDSIGNGLLHSIGAQYGGSVVHYLRDSTPPTINPGGGGLLYSEAGALKWRGPAGTVTVIAPA